ncbi:DNA-directed RNA polymerase III subunit RPC7 isoform X1 [Temnothorax longispinosus]|uniref:DNA-directed RNA polymerase III subunit RPC7 isoform X1 n=1 Tax=Temnothorax longispinosus TaxID=300112 RepID=UPI003A98EF09
MSRQKVLARKMAGRGRGKSTMSFSMEQLGISKGETLPAPVVQPSLHYPQLDHKPLPIQLTTEMSYLVELKRDFTEYMRESPNNVQAAVLNEDVERFCEDFDEAVTECDKSKYEAYHDWNRMPMQLKLSRKRKSRQQSVGCKKKKKDVDIVKKLTELEEKESVQQPAEEENKEEGNEEENGEGKEMAERIKDEEEIDEMDDGTDYANEYFENGDNYYSEDDNDDDQFFDT